MEARGYKAVLAKPQTDKSGLLFRPSDAVSRHLYCTGTHFWCPTTMIIARLAYFNSSVVSHQNQKNSVTVFSRLTHFAGRTVYSVHAWGALIGLGSSRPGGYLLGWGRHDRRGTCRDNTRHCPSATNNIP